VSLLVVAAAAAEATAAVRRLAAAPQRACGLPAWGADTAAGEVLVVAGGVGPAAAAAATAAVLASGLLGGGPEAVLSVGIAGGFRDRAPVGSVVLATASPFADLGSGSPGGFLPLAELGFGTPPAEPPAELLAALRDRLADALAAPPVVGDVLTLATMTGTDERAAELAARHPAAVAEAMEGAGVAAAARLAGIPFVELRTDSNAIGRRDRAAWRIPPALDALATAVAAVCAGHWPAAG
jgi:futalosine hydrolase